MSIHLKEKDISAVMNFPNTLFSSAPVFIKYKIMTILNVIFNI